MNAIISRLLCPDRLFSRAEILARPNPIPQDAGIYAWYFDDLPPGIASGAYHVFDGRTLLYVGISPKEAPTNGAPASRQTLRTRLRTHYGGNAAGSTLRLTLGCLLARCLGLTLRRVGSGKRYTFTNPGECVLDRWMAQHAYVTWAAQDEPWLIENQMLTSGLELPLNIHGNPHDHLAKVVSLIRREHRRTADMLPVVTDSGGPRRQTLVP
jgi:hypothetical protein